VAGPPEPLGELLAHCEASEIDARRIDVDYASHTPAVAAIRDELAGLLAGITPRPPRIPLYSTLTGEPLDGAAMDAGYWYANLASPVRFEPATRALLDSGHRLFIEVSPHPVLALGVQETAEAAGQDVVCAATAWTAGQPVNWAALLPPGRPAPLPGYAFDRQRYWLGPPAAAAPASPGRTAGHPLLPELTELAGSGGLLLAGTLSVARHPWLADHAVGGDILLPGTALADLAAVAAERAGCPRIAELILERPLVLPADGEVMVQVTAGAAAPDGTRPVTVHSRPGGQDSEWTRHATGTLTNGPNPASPPVRGDGQPDPRDGSGAAPVTGPGGPWPPPGAEPLDLDELYHRLTARGYAYGPAFRGLKAAWRHGPDLLADITLPGSAQPGNDGYRLHPALLDPALHLLLGSTPQPAAEDTEPGHRGEELRSARDEPSAPGQRPGRANPDGAGPAGRDGQAGQPDGTGTGNLEDPGSQDGAGPGRIVLPFCWTELTLAGAGVTMLRVRLSPAGRDCWTMAGAAPPGRPVVAGTVTLRPQAADAAHPDAAHPDAGQDALLRVEWQPLTESRSGQTVPGQAGTGPGRSQQALPGLGVIGQSVTDQDGDGRDGWVTVGPAVPGADGPRVTELAAVRDPVPGVVICPVPGGDGELPAAAGETVAAVVGMVQEWLGEDRFAGSRLVLVTTNAVAAVPGDRVDGLAQAPVWGLARSAQAENPGRLSLLDLDGQPAPDAVRTAIAAGADQAVIRGNQVLAPRLAPAGRPPLAPPDGGGPWRLAPAGRGLDRLVLRHSPEAARPLEHGQVRISVRAAGLNFRDITIATGLLPGEHGLGIEGAGVITETGPGVTHLAPGDAVLGLLRDAFGPVAVADARALAKIPDGWSFAQAASVPVAFLTAWDALAEVAAVQPGDSVLVHAAAGGVGLAATQIARHLGATVYGTASPGKQAATGLPRGRVASSRSLEFEPKLRDAAGPPGLDVVLNCLAGEYTDASLRLLAPGGRFVEIGKTDLRDPAGVARAHPGVRYQAYNLMDLPPDRAGLLLREVLALFECGALTLPPVTAWDLRSAPAAFAHMRHARHTGKIVLTSPPPLDPDGTVLVTGGTGTLGALAARHLIEAHGARKVLLTSRRGPDAPGARELAGRLGKLGASVRIAACDVTDRDSLARVLGGTRLTAVVHAAGVLDDGLVTGLTPSRLARVLAPKADAAWLLHELTAGHDLAAFVLFSSASGILGEPGQANYAAANAGLDALAQYRRARGLPGLSLAWGVWQQRSGMTGHLTGADLERLSRSGMGALPSAAGLALLDAALARDEALAVPMRLAQGPAAAASPALAGRAPGEPAPGKPAPAGDDQEQLLDLVRRHAAAALGHSDPGTVGPDQAFRDLGFDSLTGVELRNRLSSSTGLRLPAGLISDNPTPEALTRYLRGLLASAGNPA
jgi:NADPH:quinone reductase-like Zn-dependent oxidoreductase/acyl carrier protein